MATNDNLRTIDPITINATANDWWVVADMISPLSGIKGADNLMDSLQDWLDANAINAAYNLAATGNPGDAETIMGMYDGDLETDADSPCFDPDSDWRSVADAINAARNPEPDPEPDHTPANPGDALRESDEAYRIWDDALIWLDNSPKAHDGWRIVEEAARIASTPGYKTNLHTAGRVYGMATALEVTAWIEGADAGWWLGFIEDFAESNYENGARIEE